jgi:hypothetical protein
VVSQLTNLWTVSQWWRTPRNCRKDGRTIRKDISATDHLFSCMSKSVGNTCRMGEWIRRKVPRATSSGITTRRTVFIMHGMSCSLYRSNSKSHRSDVCLYRPLGGTNNEGCIGGVGEKREDHLIALNRTRSGQTATKILACQTVRS